MQDALAHGGLEPAAFPLERGCRSPAVQGTLHAGGDVAQGGQVSHQVAVGERAYGANPEHRAAPALAPLQEQPGIPPVHRVPTGHFRQRRAVGGGQRAQLGGPERTQVQIEHGQAAVTCGQHSPPAPFRLAPGRLGQPAGAAGTQLASMPCVGGGAQLTGGLIAPTASQCQSTCEQVGIDSTRRVQFVQPRGHAPGRLQQLGRTVLTLGKPAEQQGQLGASGPPRALLTPEQPQGFGAAILRQAEVARRGGGHGRGIEQLGAPGRRAMLPLDRGHCRVDLAQRIPCQACRQQHCALVDEQVRFEDAQLVIQHLGMVEVGERSGEVPAGVRGQSAFLAGGCVVRLLAAFEPQRLHPSVVPVSPLDVAHSEVDRCLPVQGTRFPDQVARPGELANCGPGVPQGLGIAAQDVADSGPADQDPAGQDATAALQQGIQNRQAAPGLPSQNQGGAQAGGDIGFPVQVPGLAREPARILELLDRFPDIAEVSEDQPGRLVRDSGLRRRRMPGQHLTGGGEGLRWLRQCQRQQFVRFPSHQRAVSDDRHL